MRIGDYTLAALETGRFYLDGGAMFGVVPKVFWERSNPADARNARLPLLVGEGKGEVGSVCRRILSISESFLFFFLRSLT